MRNTNSHFSAPLHIAVMRLRGKTNSVSILSDANTTLNES
jgi:hypothetical protein